MGSTKRTTLRLSGERQRLLDEAKAIVAGGQYDDQLNSDVIDAAQRFSTGSSLLNLYREPMVMTN